MYIRNRKLDSIEILVICDTTSIWKKKKKTAEKIYFAL